MPIVFAGEFLKRVQFQTCVTCTKYGVNKNFSTVQIAFKDLQSLLFWVVSGPGPQVSTSQALPWIQRKLGKQYLRNKVTLPWESNPGPTPIRGDIATIIVSVGLKKHVAIRHYIQVR